MRLLTLFLGSAVLFGCVGTHVVEIDTLSEVDWRSVVDAAENQSGQVVTGADVVRFKKGKLDVTRDTLRVLPPHRESGTPLILPLRDNSVDVRFRFKGSPLGAVIGVVAGSTAGYAIGYSSGEGSGFCCTRKENAVFGAAIVGVVGAIVGAVVGPKKTTIYRFRPDTPQQMSVVVRVGPTTSHTKISGGQP